MEAEQGYPPSLAAQLASYLEQQRNLGETERDPDLHLETDIFLDSRRTRLSTKSYASTGNRKSALSFTSKTNEDLRTRARPKKPHEPSPFLSIDTLPIEKQMERPTTVPKRKSKSSKDSRPQPWALNSARPRQTSAMGRNTPAGSRPNTGSRIRSANRKQGPIAADFIAFPNASNKYRSPNQGPHKPSTVVKTPFKHNVSNQQVAEAQLTFTPSEDMKEKMALATYHVSRVLATQPVKEERKIQGRLLKAKLKPLDVVNIDGPSIEQCRGIIAETRHYSPSPNRTLQRRRHIMDTIAKEYAYKQSGEVRSHTESVHQTSVASDLTEDRMKELEDEDADTDEEEQEDEIAQQTVETENKEDEDIENADQADELEENAEIEEKDQLKVVTAQEALTETTSLVSREVHAGDLSNMEMESSDNTGSVQQEVDSIRERPIKSAKTILRDPKRPTTAPDGASKSVRFMDEDKTSDGELISRISSAKSDKSSLRSKSSQKSSDLGREIMKQSISMFSVQNNDSCADLSVAGSSIADKTVGNIAELKSEIGVTSVQSNQEPDMSLNKQDRGDNLSLDNLNIVNNISKDGDSNKENEDEGQDTDEKRKQNSRESCKEDILELKRDEYDDDDGRGDHGHQKKDASENQHNNASGPTNETSHDTNNKDSGHSSDQPTDNLGAQISQFLVNRSLYDKYSRSAGHSKHKKRPSSANFVRPSSSVLKDRPSSGALKSDRSSSDALKSDRPLSGALKSDRPSSGALKSPRSSAKGHKQISHFDRNTRAKNKNTSPRRSVKKPPTLNIYKFCSPYLEDQSLAKPESKRVKQKHRVLKSDSGGKNQKTDLSSFPVGRESDRRTSMPSDFSDHNNWDIYPNDLDESVCLICGLHADMCVCPGSTVKQPHRGISKKQDSDASKKCDGKNSEWMDDFSDFVYSDHSPSSDEEDVIIPEDFTMDDIEKSLAEVQNDISRKWRSLENLSRILDSSMSNYDEEKTDLKLNLSLDANEDTDPSKGYVMDTERFWMSSDCRQLLLSYRAKCITADESCPGHISDTLTVPDMQRIPKLDTDEDDVEPKVLFKRDDTKTLNLTEENMKKFSEGESDSKKSSSKLCKSKHRKKSVDTVSDSGVGSEITSTIDDAEARDEEKEFDSLLEMITMSLPEPETKEKLNSAKDEIAQEKDLTNLKVVATTKTLLKPERTYEPDPPPVAPYPPICFRINARPPEGQLYYFAYGTDMNASRFSTYIKREVTCKLWGLLFGFQLKFNKMGADVEAGSFPNIEFNPFSSVEGILYTITTAELTYLDQAVGYPVHFEHLMLPVWMMNCPQADDYGVASYCVPALTFIAQDKWIVPDHAGLNHDYSLSQCVKSADVLTPSYQEHLMGL